MHLFCTHSHRAAAAQTLSANELVHRSSRRLITLLKGTLQYSILFSEVLFLYLSEIINRWNAMKGGRTKGQASKQSQHSHSLMDIWSYLYQVKWSNEHFYCIILCSSWGRRDTLCTAVHSLSSNRVSVFFQSVSSSFPVSGTTDLITACTGVTVKELKRRACPSSMATVECITMTSSQPSK